MARESRFPGIVWYCDKCEACLSSQKGFNDHKYIWKCRECGYKNSISWDNVASGDSAGTKILLYFLGFLSFAGFWTSVMLGLSMFVFQADRNVYLIPFLIFLGIYLIAFSLTIVLQFTIRHKKRSFGKIVYEIFYDFCEDLFAPVNAIKEILSNAFSFIAHLFPGKRKYGLHFNFGIVAFSLIYLVLIIVEIILFNRINHLSIADWWTWIKEGVKGISSFVSGLVSK